MKGFVLCTVAKEQKRTDAGVISFAMTTKDEDRDGDIIEPKGAVLNHFLSNPVFLWAHDHRRPPIGRVMPETITISDNAVLADVKFDLNDPFAKMVYEKYKNGFLNAGSIRFRPLEYEPIQQTETDENGNERVVRTTGWHIKKWELLEFSAVPIPANPMALAQKGQYDPIELEITEQLDFAKETSQEVPVEQVYEEWVKQFADEKGNDKDLETIVTDLYQRVEELARTVEELKSSSLSSFHHASSSTNPNTTHGADASGTMDGAGGGGSDTEPEKDEDISKAVVPFKPTQKASEDRSWDKTAAISRLRKWASKDGTGNKDTIDWAKYRQAFAWYDPNDAKNFEGYKLPHHDVENGQLVVVWAGVRAAMAALMGARGGVNIPDSDRKGVYNHLAKHYKQFEKEPPEFKELELLDSPEEFAVDLLLNNEEFQERIVENVVQILQGGN